MLELGRWAGLSFSRRFSDIWASRGLGPLGLLNSVLTLSYWWLERGIGRESQEVEVRLSPDYRALLISAVGYTQVWAGVWQTEVAPVKLGQVCVTPWPSGWERRFGSCWCRNFI